MVWRSHPWTAFDPLFFKNAGRLDSSRDPLDRWLTGSLDHWFQPMTPRSSAPALDLWRDEASGDLVLEAEVPGCAPEDLELKLEGRELLLRVRREDVTTERRLRLPTTPDADAVEASWKDGLLAVRIPAAPAERSRTIAIQHRG